MSEPDIKFIVKDFRAIANANIALDGISVLTGENGSGKSTMSNQLYELIYHLIRYDKLVDNQFETLFSSLRDVLGKISTEFPILDISSYLVHNASEIDILKILTSIEEISTTYKELQKNNRLKGIIKKNILDVIYEFDNRISKNLEEKPVSKEVLNENNIIKNSVTALKAILNKKQDLKTVRPRTYLNKLLLSSVKLFEFGIPIISNTENKTIPFYSFDKVFFYDTPFVLGDIESDNRFYRSDLIEAISSSGDSTFDSKHFDFLKIVSENITNGTFDLKIKNKSINNSVEFMYKRKDGSIFDLLECATGLRSFAILQLLIQKGLLTEKTLLIIDEPEAHLHPQWIVEYARLIVLLNKELGVKFLISSHNPDMISAIKYIAEKEKVDEKLNFYLAEKAEQEFKYNFVNLHTNIEPIFASFNIALDRIDEYGAVE